VTVLFVPPTASNPAEWTRTAARAINQLAAARLNVQAKDAAYTITDGDDVILCDATSAAFTLTLPKAGLHGGRVFYLKKVDASANAITIDGDGSETIDGAATQSLSVQWESKTLTSDGTGWFII
jgi:hypothetical protein